MAYESSLQKHCNFYGIEATYLKPNRALETRVRCETNGEFRIVSIVLILFDSHFSYVVRRGDDNVALRGRLYHLPPIYRPIFITP